MKVGLDLRSDDDNSYCFLLSKHVLEQTFMSNDRPYNNMFTIISLIVYGCRLTAFQFFVLGAKRNIDFDLETFLTFLYV